VAGEKLDEEVEVKSKSSKSFLFDLLVKIYQLGKKLRWNLAEKRLKWQRPAFYQSLGLPQKIHVGHTISPFLKTIELDATIFAFTGEVDKLRECLERKVSPDLRGLMENAFLADRVQNVKLLLAYGANPNRAVYPDGTTCLHEATIRGNPEIVELLLAKGADPNRETRDGIKALSYAYDRTEGRAPLVKLLKPVTTMDRHGYQLDDFLKMEDPVKAYYALCEGIRNGFRHRSPAELRILSLMEFTGHCWPNGFTTMDDHARWAAVPCAELMEAIDEPIFANVLRRCIAIVREYGQKIGRDPFDPDADYVALDEETENRLNSPDFDFFKYDYDDQALCRKTMDYVRKHREWFVESGQT
jgi:hypothetical protein